MSTSLASRGANAKPGARLPSLQALRVDDPQIQRAFEALREWCEVRLGSRGDPNERAVTGRDLQQALAPLNALAKTLGNFDGTVGTLRATSLGQLPPVTTAGAFAQVGDDLYYCNGKAWRKVTLTPV